MQVGVRKRGQSKFMDSGCCKHMTEITDCFLLLKALKDGGVSFGDKNKSYILGVGKIGKSLNYAIEDVYYVNSLKYNLLSVFQICDKGNEVKLLSG